MGSFPGTYNDPKPLPCLRQKSVILLPSLRQETSFNKNVSFSWAYRINFFFTELDFLEKKSWYGTTTYLKASVSKRHPIEDPVVKLYALFKSQDHENYTLLSDINPAKKGITPLFIPYFVLCQDTLDAL